MLSPTLWHRTSLSPFDGLFDFGGGRTLDYPWNRSSAFPTGTRASRGATRRAWIPAVDVAETADAVRIQVELPGIHPDDIDVVVQNNVLTVRGQKDYSLDEECTFHFQERGYGRFERSFNLPATVLADDMQAEYDHGVLNLTLPKKEEARARRIPINATGSNGRSLGSGS